MSLQLAAQHLASKGRGPDTTLVHMAPGEVDSLQAIAKAHGGSLTVNPDTGLPEAGFLSSILPMIAGVGLTAVSGGALSPVMAGLLTGGVTGVATGNLGKGLMAGLGAYGGAGLGGALATAGGNALTQEALLKANPGMNAIDIAQNGAGFTLPEMSMTDKMMAGVKGLGSEEGRDLFMKNIGGVKGLFKSGYTAALPMMLAQSGETARPPSTASDTPYSSEYIPGYTGAGPSRDSSESLYLNPRYIRRRAAGGETYADGGDTGMTGQSDDYYRYLMGLAPAPRPYTPAPVAAPAATEVSTAPLAVTNPMVRRGDTYSDSMAFDDYNNPQNPNAWGNLTPMQQATFYANNPGYQTATQKLQELFSGTLLGKAQAALDPEGRALAFNVANTVPAALIAAQEYNAALQPQATSNAAQQAAQEYNASLELAAAQQAAQGTSNAAQQAAQEYNESLSMAPASPSVTQADLDDTASGIAADVNAANEAGIAAGIDPGEFARGGLSAAYARGGYNLGDYSDGGRLLRGPGDGVSDSIPASIANKRPARLADGEFVVPARIVSELGNGSTEAGARRLYEMMDRIQKNRRKTTGKGKVAVNSRSDKYLPA